MREKRRNIAFIHPCYAHGLCSWHPAAAVTSLESGAGSRHSPYSVAPKLSSAQRAAAFARVAEKRHVTSSGFWGQAGLDKGVKPVKRDLPAFWSLGLHGQPFNDERLTDGSSNHFKVAEPPNLGAPAPRPAGPATESLATLKSSLQNGFALFHNDASFSPLSMKPGTVSQLRK